MKRAHKLTLNRNVILIVIFLSYLFIVVLLHHRFKALECKLSVADVLPLLLVSLTATLIKGVRWYYLLKESGIELRFRDTYLIYLAGLIGVVTPAKVGDVVKSVLLKKKFGFRHRVVLPTILMERITDVISLCILSLLGVLRAGSAIKYIAIGVFATFLMVFILKSDTVLSLLLSRIGKGSKRTAARVILRNTRKLMKLRVITISTVIDSAGWVVEATILYYLIHLYGYNMGFASTIFTYVFSVLAGVLIFLPGGLGATDVSMVALLVWNGIPAATATSITALFRIFTFWFHAGMGVFFSTLVSKK